jgi:hypothetical protein
LMNLPESEAVPAMQTIVTYREAGRPLEAYIYPGEFHEKWQAADRLEIYRRNVQWMVFWLLGRELPDPVDAEQYIRWRAFRQDQNPH